MRCVWKRCSWAFVRACLVTLLFCSDGHALVIADAPHEIEDFGSRILDLKERAHLVVLAKTVHVEPFRRNEGIFTRVTFQIERVYKGDLQEPLVFELYGGCIDGEASFIDEIPQFNEMERYILFISKNDNQISQITKQEIIRVDSDSKIPISISIDGCASANRLIDLDEFEEIFLKELPSKIYDPHVKRSRRSSNSSKESCRIIVSEEPFGENEFGISR